MKENFLFEASCVKQPVLYFLEGCLFQAITIPFGVLVDWASLIPGMLESSENYHDLWMDSFYWNQSLIAAYNDTANLWKYEDDFHSWEIREWIWAAVVNPLFKIF